MAARKPVAPGQVGVAPLPGSSFVLDRGTNTLVPCTPARCPHALPYDVPVVDVGTLLQPAAVAAATAPGPLAPAAAAVAAADVSAGGSSSSGSGSSGPGPSPPMRLPKAAGAPFPGGVRRRRSLLGNAGGSSRDAGHSYSHSISSWAATAWPRLTAMMGRGAGVREHGADEWSPVTAARRRAQSEAAARAVAALDAPLATQLVNFAPLCGMFGKVSRHVCICHGR